MSFDFDFLEHSSCQLVCFDDFPDSIREPEDVERNSKKRKQKKTKGSG